MGPHERLCEAVRSGLKNVKTMRVVHAIHQRQWYKILFEFLSSFSTKGVANSFCVGSEIPVCSTRTCYTHFIFDMCHFLFWFVVELGKHARHIVLKSVQVSPESFLVPKFVKWRPVAVLVLIWKD